MTTALPTSAPYWDAAKKALAAADPLLAAVIKNHSDRLQSRGEALTTLLRSVVGQQISVKAAESVWKRFVDAAVVLDPPHILAMTDVQLRTCGLSGSKARYVRGIAQGFLDGTVHPGLWDDMDDEAIILELVKLPGIGRWTAEMFLIFFLLKPDVLPVDDLGLVKGFKLVYGGKWKTETDLKGWKKRIVKYGAVWRPYRSVATWYLWRSLDPVVVEY